MATILKQQKTLIMIKLKKYKFLTKLSNSNSHKTQKLKFWQNSKTQIIPKLYFLKKNLKAGKDFFHTPWES